MQIQEIEQLVLNDDNFYKLIKFFKTTDTNIIPCVIKLCGRIDLLVLETNNLSHNNFINLFCHFDIRKFPIEKQNCIETILDRFLPQIKEPSDFRFIIDKLIEHNNDKFTKITLMKLVSRFLENDISIPNKGFLNTQLKNTKIFKKILKDKDLYSKIKKLTLNSKKKQTAKIDHAIVPDIQDLPKESNPPSNNFEEYQKNNLKNIVEKYICEYINNDIKLSDFSDTIPLSNIHSGAQSPIDCYIKKEGIISLINSINPSLTLKSDYLLPKNNDLNLIINLYFSNLLYSSFLHTLMYTERVLRTLAKKNNINLDELKDVHNGTVENSKLLKDIIEDFSSFFTTYPIHIPEFSDLGGGDIKISNDKSLFTEENLHSYVSKKQYEAEVLMDNYFKTIFKEFIISESAFEEFMNVFPEFNLQYLEEDFYSLAKDDLKDHVSISDVNLGINFGYEGLETQNLNANEYSLNLKSFINKMI